MNGARCPGYTAMPRRAIDVVFAWDTDDAPHDRLRDVRDWLLLALPYIPVWLQLWTSEPGRTDLHPFSEVPGNSH